MSVALTFVTIGVVHEKFEFHRAPSPAAAAASQTSFFTLGALIAIGVSTFSPGKPSSEDSKSRPFMGRQASWLSELSTSTTAGKRD